MNKNLCIRRAIKRNRFGAERDSRMGPESISRSGSPDKARGIASFGSQRPPPRIRRRILPLSRISPPIGAGSSLNCCREIYSTYTSALANARVWKGFTVPPPPTLPPFSSPGGEIGFTILRCPWKPGTSGLCAARTFILYPTRLLSEYAILQCGFFFLFFPPFFISKS